MFRFDGDDLVIDLDHAARPDQFFRIELVDAFRTVDKMIGRVDMRAGVNTERDLGNICGIAARKRFECGNRNAGIAFVDRHVGADRDCHIKNSHGIRIIDKANSDNAITFSPCALCPLWQNSFLYVKLSMMDIKHIEGHNRGAFIIKSDHKRLAELTYSKSEDKPIDIDHTEVDESQRGQ